MSYDSNLKIAWTFFPTQVHTATEGIDQTLCIFKGVITNIGTKKLCIESYSHILQSRSQLALFAMRNTQMDLPVKPQEPNEFYIVESIPTGLLKDYSASSARIIYSFLEE